MTVAHIRAAPDADSLLLRRAEERLRVEGLHRATAYRIERRAPARWWAAYERRGNAWTAIFAGEVPEDWQLVRTLEGWPVTPDPGTAHELGAGAR